MTIGTATYSPDDNKIRITPFARLDEETYKKIRTGYTWALQQKLFFALWSPDREDMAIELCGEITDEDTTLVERAEERADRFQGHSENRQRDADSAHDRVKAICDDIPFGQPILIGHHSEKHARRAAEKIDQGMRKAVAMWETSKYWISRAAGAIQHAKHAERPDVRARRIKKIEAERRRTIRAYTPDNPEQTITQAPFYCPICRDCMCGEHEAATIQTEHVFCGASRGGCWVEVSRLPFIERGSRRWIAHYDNRLIYERAMLHEAGYAEPVKVKAKHPPILNYDYGSINVQSRWTKGKVDTLPVATLTKAQWANIDDGYKGTMLSEDGSHRVRMGLGVHLGLRSHDRSAVYLSDGPKHTRPEPIEVTPPAPQTHPTIPLDEAKPIYSPQASERTVFDDMKDSLKNGGVQTISAPQLFPTPPDLAARMVGLAEIEPGQCVLEPSAGTGNIIKAVRAAVDTEILAYEISQGLCTKLRQRFDSFECTVIQADFLTVTDFQDRYPRVIMNPPFKNGDDIKHIKHALTFLKSGGRLVAICANGPRQNEQLKPLADTWEKLPDNTFVGTGVSAVLLVINAGNSSALPEK